LAPTNAPCSGFSSPRRYDEQTKLPMKAASPTSFPVERARSGNPLALSPTLTGMREKKVAFLGPDMGYYNAPCVTRCWGGASRWRGWRCSGVRALVQLILKLRSGGVAHWIIPCDPIQKICGRGAGVQLDGEFDKAVTAKVSDGPSIPPEKIAAARLLVGQAFYSVRFGAAVDGAARLQFLLFSGGFVGLVAGCRGCWGR